MFRLLHYIYKLNLPGYAVIPNNLRSNRIHAYQIISRIHLYAIIFTVLATGSTASFSAEQDSSAAQINPTTVTARGNQSAILTLKAFGRYSITVNSSQGVALQTLDRMSGTGEIAGIPGKKDGRLDLFLDRGTYKILTHAAEQGNGQAKLNAHAFRELNTDRPSMLIDERVERTSLGDFEQRSYWLEIKEQRTVAIEAAGRHLADLRLWRDGIWLVDSAPEMITSQARADHPLSVARFTTKLEPGLYLVTAYGGPSQPWTDAATEKPFLLRFGMPKLATAMRQQFTMSEFGVERFLVPNGPNYFRLELPVADTASLQVNSYNELNPFQSHGAIANIDKRSLPPVAELNGVKNDDEKLITVTMEAGKSFILQHFNAATTINFTASGNYWISSIHAGYAGDSIGATAVLTRRPFNGNEEYLDAQTVDMTRGITWHRRFNLLDELTLFVKLSEPSKINVIGQGVKARYRFEPFLTSRPRDYKTPPWQENGYVFELDRGLYVLSVIPETKGILDLQLLPPGGVLNQALSYFSKAVPEVKSIIDQNLLATDNAKRDNLSPVSPVVRFSDTSLDGNASYTMYLNRQPGVTSGVVLRPLPIDLRESLPVTQRAGERITIPIRVSESGILRAVTENGRVLEIVLDNNKKGSAIAVGAGRYTVSIKESNTIQMYSLVLEPARLASQTPLPAMPDTTLAGLPKFPTIFPGTPFYLDLKRTSSSSFKVQVEKPGLYQFETTGLLRTHGKVRTRTNPSLFNQSENGIGRNFLIQNYLRAGEYQLSVDTVGETEGHLGVKVTRTEVIEGGELRAGEVARALLPSTQALAYNFRINQRGTYHFQAMGLGRNFRLRLEDKNGWPLFRPEINGDFTEEFMPGDYRLIILPQTAEARVLTRLTRVISKKRYTGHGPHLVGLESKTEHVWREPAKGAPRIPDQWDFDLPATADISLSIDSDMEATLVNITDPQHPIARIEARSNWIGRLPTGRYRVRAQHSRSNNHMSYTLQISSTQLLAGLSREILTPAVIPISVGTDGLVELQSFGASDVRARLVDSSGEIVTQSDDRPDDWNFHIVQRLRPGEYILFVDPVNEKQAQTRVFMHAPGEIIENPMILGSDTEIRDERVHVYPLIIPADRTLLLVSAQSTDTVGLALEGESKQGWINLGTALEKTPYLALPIVADRFRAYRLRAWSADRRSLKVRVRASAAALPVTTENQWLQGSISMTRVDDVRSELQVAMISLTRPGTFRIKGDLARLQWSDGGACAEQMGNNAVIGVSGKTLWLISHQNTSDESPSFSAERLKMPIGEQESLRLELMAGRIGAIDLQSHTKGPSLLLAQARTGQPGIAMSMNNEPNRIGLTPGVAVTMALPTSTESAFVWNAATPGTSIELDVRQVPLQWAGIETFGMGARDGVINSRMALPIKIPHDLSRGTLRVRLTLSAMSAAIFLKSGVILSTHWSGEDTLQETEFTDADELWLLNADSRIAHYSLEISQGTVGSIPVLKPGELLEHNLSTAGRMRVPVVIPPIEKSKSNKDFFRLRINGNTQILWLEKGGRIASGNDIIVRDSGVLWLQHQPGTLVAWLEEPLRSPGTQLVTEWFKSLRETPIKPPQTVNLSGKSQILSLQLEQPTMIHVRTSVPVVTHFMVEGTSPKTEAHLQGANINLLAPTGLSRLVLRAVGADNLSGVATVMITEVTRLNEGAGSEVLLAPGSARLFSFEIKQRTPIGIGVRASSDIVNSILYNSKSVVQSQGVVQMPTLSPGRYYLSIEAPNDTAPILVQPIIFGLIKPDTRPPYEILRRYIEGRNSDALIYMPQPLEISPDVIPVIPDESSPSTDEDSEFPQSSSEDEQDTNEEPQ